jgi:hypothetical protein
MTPPITTSPGTPSANRVSTSVEQIRGKAYARDSERNAGDHRR